MATAWNFDAETIRELDDLVASGRFASPEAAVREGLRLIRKSNDADETVDLDSLDPETRRAIEIGIADADAGRLIPIEDVRAEMKRRFSSRL